MVNYIKEYFKTEEHDLTSLIGSSSTNNDDLLPYYAIYMV